MTDLGKMARDLLPVDICRYGYEVDEMATVVSFSTAIDAIRTALLTAPPGWKLVPVEPTHIQLDAAVEGRKQGGLYGAYVAAIAAAPEVK